jgi:hypothetical protein
MTTRLLLAALAALAPATAIAAQTAPAASVAAVTDFANAPAASGSWGYQAAPGGSSARFVDTSAIARLTIQCTRATRRVNISQTSAAPSATLLVWTSSSSRNLAARFEPNAMRVSAELAAMDPLLDAIAFSRGRIAVQLAGSQPLVVPAGPEAARVVEDCRT